MCRNARVQQQVIAAAKNRADEVYAVYEEDGGPRNMTTIIEVIGNEGTSYDVYRYGDVEVRRRVPHLFDKTMRALARSFDVDRRTCMMVAC